MKAFMPVRSSAAKTGALINIRSTRMKIIAIDDRPAIRDESVVVENGSPAVMPIESPMVKTPAETAEESDPESQPKTDPRAVQEEPRIRVPTREDRQRNPIHQPGIVLRHVNYVGR